MSATHPDGSRKPFAIEFITANRENFRKRKRMLAHLATLSPKSSDHELLLQQIKDIDIGGKYIAHNECMISRPRGMHVKTTNSETSIRPNHSANRTRNIVFMPGNQIRKIHNSLIISFNNHEVIY